MTFLMISWPIPYPLNPLNRLKSFSLLRRGAAVQLQLKQPEKECLQVAMEMEKLCGGGTRQWVAGQCAPQAEP